LEKKTFLRIGLGLAAAEAGTVAAIYLASYVLFPLIYRAFPYGGQPLEAAVYLLYTALQYAVLIVIAWLFVRNLPSGPVTRAKCPAGFFIAIYLIAQGTTYLISIGSSFLHNYVLRQMAELLSHWKDVPGPIEQVDSIGIVHVAEVIATVVFAPVCEELLFRKILLDKLRPFGDAVAILFTGIAFGLTHGNFQQFFFATFIGFLFGYLVIKTGQLLYTIILHFIVNSMSSIVIPNLLKLDGLTPQLGTLLTSGIIYAMLVIGTVIFLCNLKKIKLSRSSYEFSRPVGVEFILSNPGTLVYIAAMVLYFGFRCYLYVMQGNYT